MIHIWLLEIKSVPLHTVYLALLINTMIPNNNFDNIEDYIYEGVDIIIYLNLIELLTYLL